MSTNKSGFGHPISSGHGRQPSSLSAMTDPERLAKMQQLMNEPQEDDITFIPNQQHSAADEENVDPAPADLRKLMFLGRVQDRKTIAGYSFEVRTLTSTEQDEVWLSLSFLNGDSKVLMIKRPILVRAIVSVNGASLDELYSGKDYNALTPLQRATSVVGELQQELVNELFEFYGELVDRSKKSIRPDLIKKS